MEQSRREFLAGSIAKVSGLTVAAALGAVAADPPSAEATAATPTRDDSFLKFWTTGVRDRGDKWRMGQAARRSGMRAASDDYTPTFYVASDTGPLTSIDKVDPKELESSPDVLLEFKVITYKPSAADQKKKLQAGSLRIDVTQATPPPEFSQPYSWSTISSLALTDNHLPNILKKIVDPSTFWSKDSDSIVLPSGTGYLTNNLFLQEAQHPNFWQEVFAGIRTGIETVGIVTNIGLPLINATALKVVDGLYGSVAYINSTSIHKVLQSSSMPIATNQAAMANVDPNDRPLAIKTGDYIAVPALQSSDFEKEVLNNYKLVKGYLVPNAFASTNEEDLNAEGTSDATLEKYTYLVINFTVAPYTMPAVPVDIGPLLGYNDPSAVTGMLSPIVEASKKSAKTQSQ